MPQAKVICSGLVERIGLEDAKFTYNTASETIKKTEHIPDHETALTRVAQQLLDKTSGSISSSSAIDVIGHRVVHGGKYFNQPTLITEAVIAKIEALSTLAPLHNPANLKGITVASSIFPKAKQVAVFDTAFHQSIPEYAYKYAIPNNFLDEDNIRVYGFHGTSHKFVSEKAIAYLNQTSSKIITIHLGNGCSITAVKDGKSIEHSMGFSPTDGLIMGTRSGNIDPAIIFHLASKYNYSFDTINTILQKKSGMLGLTGYSDLRDIQNAASNGDASCEMALIMNAYRIKKYIGSYAAILNGLDAIVFTAGIGENSADMRARICTDLDYLGIQINLKKNAVRSEKLLDISATNAKVKTLVIPTNEELEIAQQASKTLLKT